MKIRLVLIFLIIFVTGNISGQQKEKDSKLFMDKEKSYLGVGVGWSFYNQYYLNTYFDNYWDKEDHGFDGIIMPSFFVKPSLNFEFSHNYKLSTYFEATIGTELDVLDDHQNSFVIYSPGFDLKRYFPFASGRHSIFGSVGYKYSIFNFSKNIASTGGVKLQTGVNIQQRKLMVQPFTAVNFALNRKEGNTFISKFLYSDIQIGVEFFF